MGFRFVFFKIRLPEKVLRNSRNDYREILHFYRFSSGVIHRECSVHSVGDEHVETSLSVRRMVAASVVVVGMTMGQSATLPVTPSRPMAQSAEPRKDVHSPVPPQAGGLENLSEEDRRVLAKRSKDLVEARKAKFEQELAKLQEVIRRLPDAPPELRGRETLDSLTQLQAILLSYKDSAQGVIDQWPDLEVRASNYEKALLSAPRFSRPAPRICSTRPRRRSRPVNGSGGKLPRRSSKGRLATFPQRLDVSPRSLV